MEVFIHQQVVNQGVQVEVHQEIILEQLRHLFYLREMVMQELIHHQKEIQVDILILPHRFLLTGKEVVEVEELQQQVLYK
jgi:hypothetical protein